jgi:hypothetical protein
MSHSLHRFGTPEDLKDDFCIYARCAREVNWDAQDKLMKILDIYLSEDFVNFGSSHAGQSYIDGLDTEGCKKSLEHSYGVIMNFAKRSAGEGVLRKLRDEDLGISIVVSGLIDVVVDMARECGLKPHTATLSLGIYGKKSMLPKDDTLKIITMCGHSLISSISWSRSAKGSRGRSCPPRRRPASSPGPAYAASSTQEDARSSSISSFPDPAGRGISRPPRP